MHRLVVIFLLLGNALVAQHTDLDSIVIRHQLTGMTVMMQRNGKTLIEHYFGQKDVQRNLQVDAKTMFRIASISKTFTAIAFIQLWEKHLVDLDEDISTYLGYSVRNPRFPELKITSRMLLSHTGSVNDGKGYDDFLDSIYRPNAVMPLMRDVLAEGGIFHSNKTFLDHAPGSYFFYCNLNFGIIATIIERITGERFDRYVKKNVLNPLGIKGGFNVADLENIDDLAVLYRNNKPTYANYKGVRQAAPVGDEYVIGTNGSIFGPQGSMRISTNDLMKYLEMLRMGGAFQDKRILKKSSLDTLFKTQWKLTDSNGASSESLVGDSTEGVFREWGLGFHKITGKKGADEIWPSTKFIGHSGDAYGLISDMYMDQKKGYSIVVIINGYKNEAYQPGMRSKFFKVEEEIFNYLLKMKQR